MLNLVGVKVYLVNLCNIRNILNRTTSMRTLSILYGTRPSIYTWNGWSKLMTTMYHRSWSGVQYQLNWWTIVAENKGRTRILSRRVVGAKITRANHARHTPPALSCPAGQSYITSLGIVLSTPLDLSSLKCHSILILSLISTRFNYLINTSCF